MQIRFQVLNAASAKSLVAGVILFGLMITCNKDGSQQVAEAQQIHTVTNTQEVLENSRVKATKPKNYLK